MFAKETTTRVASRGHDRIDFPRRARRNRPLDVVTQISSAPMPTGRQALARFLRADAIVRSFPFFFPPAFDLFLFLCSPLAFTIRTGIHGPTTMTSNLSNIFHSLSFPLHLELGTPAINPLCNLTSIVLPIQIHTRKQSRYASDTVVGNSENLEGWCRKLIGSSREHNWNSRETLGLVKSRSKVA